MSSCLGGEAITFGNLEAGMSHKPVDVVSSILSNPKSLDHVRPLVAEDFTYVSPELR